LATEQSAGDHLRIVNTAVDALKIDFEDALARFVPTDLRPGVRELREQQMTQVILRVRGVSADGGPKAWFRDWDPSEGYYWRRQRRYLLDHVGRSPEALDALDDDSDRVLSYLEDPRTGGKTEFDTRGLVIGYVQSGKTENFSALIAKAADVGYQVVIVLAGIHNSLRQQTQRRLERELGLQDIGVGLPEHGRRWISLTTADLHGDFDRGIVDPNILQGNEKVIFVIKKWHTRLDQLITFIKDAKVPAHLPVLIIDDEADQASINTGGNRPDGEELEDLVDSDDPAADLQAETDPSATNERIRRIISLFQRVAYVAYTATPFANVLIPHDAHDRKVLDDVYPKDFILTLPPKPGYVGSERLFGRDTLDGEPEGEHEGLDVIRFIPDADLPLVLPVGVKIEDFEPGIPPSLDLAVIDWLLATGGMLSRSGHDVPSSMLIHTNQRTAVQNSLAPEVRSLVTRLRQEWRYGETLRIEMRRRWDTEFRPVSVRIGPERDQSFDDIEAHIDALLKDGVNVLALNSATDDVLDYNQDPNTKAVIIGGNRLSRGMTLEGLCVSYYVRGTPYYDTLLQMGRWFGYRESYVDLTRLWTTELLASWFRDLALREEELRQQVNDAERAELLPIEVGYRIRSHPAMMVTAQNKLGAARIDKLSYAGRMIQTTRFLLNQRAWLQANLAATQEFVRGLGKPSSHQVLPLWTDVPWSSLTALLSSYRTVQDRTSFDADAARRYILAQVEHGELVRWQVAVRAQAKSNDELGEVDLGIIGVGSVAGIARTRLKNDRTSIGVLTNPAGKSGPIRQGDEEIGLSDEAIMAARQQLADGKYDRIREALLAQRDPREGLLVIYPISKYSRARPDTNRINLFGDPDRDGEHVIGLALAFPQSDSAATIEYVFGSAAPESG
jgi:hypothetical protein